MSRRRSMACLLTFGPPATARAIAGRCLPSERNSSYARRTTMTLPALAITDGRRALAQPKHGVRTRHALTLTPDLPTGPGQSGSAAGRAGSAAFALALSSQSLDDRFPAGSDASLQSVHGPLHSAIPVKDRTLAPRRRNSQGQVEIYFDKVACILCWWPSVQNPGAERGRDVADVLAYAKIAKLGLRLTNGRHLLMPSLQDFGQVFVVTSFTVFSILKRRRA